MVTEIQSPAAPQELFSSIESLHGEVGKLQQELSQALSVWQGILAEEKKKFDELLERKELASQEQNAQWGKQTQDYEERLSALKNDFESRLRQTEQNAARALAELDDAWQRDKLEWGPAARAEWPAQRRELEAKAEAIEQRIAELEQGHSAEREALQARIQELENRPVDVAFVPGPTTETVKTLESQLVDFQQTVSTLQDRASQSDELVNACVQALDVQISMLHDLIHQGSVDTHVNP